MNEYVDFLIHFNEKTTDGHFHHWIDFLFFKNGYRIIRAGGLVPERWYSKDGQKDICVRNSEVQYSIEMPPNELALINWIENFKFWK